MNAIRLPSLALAMSLLLGGSLLAQRPGSQPRPAPAPAPSSRPSVSPSRPAPAPASRPSIPQSRPAPAPAPRPSAQPSRPAPSRPATTQPAPSRYTPPVRNTPTPRPAPTNPGYTPSAPTRYTPSRPATTRPGSSSSVGSSNSNPGRSYPTPRTTTRSDVGAGPQPTRSTAGITNYGSAPTTRPAPSAVGNSVRTPTSSARDLYDRAKAGRSDASAPVRTPALDSRYRPAPVKPTEPPRGSATIASRPAATGATKPATRPAPTITDRFRPADTVRPNLTTTRPNSGTTATMTSGAIVRSNTTPHLNPRSTASGTVHSPRGAGHGSVHVYDPYCDPHPYAHAWSHSHCHLHCGSGPFYWSFSLWYPWYWGYSSLWHNCYHDWWWYGSSSYGSCGTSYWWYPSSVYCPTYLYVPSSVVYVDSAAPAAPAVAAPAEAPAGGDGKAPLPRTLAEKYLELGDFYFRAGQFEEAADAYARARTYAPNDAGVHFVLADAAFANDDYHFAAFLIKEALRLDPALASAKFDKRTLYGEPKLFDEQMARLERYLEEKPYDAMAHLVRGYNLLFSDRIVTAIVAFRRVLEIAPGDVAARAFLDALEEPSAPVDGKPAAK